MKSSRIYFILIFVFHFSISCFGQSYSKQDSALNIFINQLQVKGIDTVCVYQQYCVGSNLLFLKLAGDTICKRSPFIDNTYILWKKDGITKMTFKTYCFDYDTIRVDAKRFWSFYTVNRRKMADKEIKPFEVVANINGKKTTLDVLIDHSCRQDIILIIGKRYKKLHLDDFQFEKNTHGGNNINYTYNWNTKTKTLQVLLDGLIHINYSKLSKLK